MVDNNYQCPVCKSICGRTYYTEEVGLVEEHVFCDICGYYREMCYSPEFEGISTTDFIYKKNLKNRQQVIQFYMNRIKELELEIDP